MRAVSCEKEFNISYGGSATGIFGSRDELEEQALTEEERKQKEEEEKKKQEEEEKKNNEDDNGGGTVDDIFANFRDLF